MGGDQEDEEDMAFLWTCRAVDRAYIPAALFPHQAMSLAMWLRYWSLLGEVMGSSLAVCDSEYIFEGFLGGSPHN